MQAPNYQATRPRWTNWSGNQTASPAGFAEPRDLDELSDLVRAGQAPLRVVGAGHSFTPVAVTDGTLIRLDGMGLVHSIDFEKKTAWVNAGARLKHLSPELEKHGLAFRNLGDINEQSLAGAISTATHGTGARLPCLSAEIIGLKLMTADGEMLTLSKRLDSDIFEAARVSLGALGILVEAEVQLVDAYRLHRRTWAEKLHNLVGHAPTRWRTFRNYEFFYIPFSGYGICISHEDTERAPTPRVSSDDDDAVMGLKRARDYSGGDARSRRQFLADSFARFEGEDVIGNSWELLASQRNVRFNEMEYHLPEETGLEVFEEVVRVIEKRHSDVFFPVEVRRTRGDDLWLSPFNGRGRISIAVHAYYEDDYDFFFTEIEPIFRRAGGRPHWGKLHSLKLRELSELYPEFVSFCNVRNRVDPRARFLTPYLRSLFGGPIA